MRKNQFSGKRPEQDHKSKGAHFKKNAEIRYVLFPKSDPRAWNYWSLAHHFLNSQEMGIPHERRQSVKFNQLKRSLRTKGPKMKVSDLEMLWQKSKEVFVQHTFKFSMNKITYIAISMNCIINTSAMRLIIEIIAIISISTRPSIFSFTMFQFILPTANVSEKKKLSWN